VEAILCVGLQYRDEDVTRILTAIERRDEKAADTLVPLVYQELRKLAVAKLTKEKPGQTLTQQAPRITERD
jgi:hypothetical protein